MFSTNSTPLSAVFGTDQLAVHLCPHVRLLFSPLFLSLYFEHLLQVHLRPYSRNLLSYHIQHRVRVPPATISGGENQFHSCLDYLQPRQAKDPTLATTFSAVIITFWLVFV